MAVGEGAGRALAPHSVFQRQSMVPTRHSVCDKPHCDEQRDCKRSGAISHVARAGDSSTPLH
jgi:hypothetical protein